MRLVRATRITKDYAPDFVKETVAWGAGPRAVQFLLLAGKTRAALDGRTYVSCEDIKKAAHPVLRHRILTNFAAESEGITPDVVIDQLLEHVSEKEDPDNPIPEDVQAAFAE